MAMSLLCAFSVGAMAQADKQKEAKDYAPKVGDRVRLRYRRTKKGFEAFDLDKAKIVEIIRT